MGRAQTYTIKLKEAGRDSEYHYSGVYVSAGTEQEVGDSHRGPKTA